MIIYFNSNGDITSLKPERVYQGSNDVDQFLIVAPFNTASTIELTFTLPNGQVLSPYILSGGAIFTNELNIWSFLLKSDITRFAGQVRFGVRVLGANGKVLATGSDTFVVERGTAPTLPPEPTPDVYEQILELLGLLNINKVDRVDVSDPDYIVGYTYSKDGVKTPNALYYNYDNDVISFDGTNKPNIKGAVLTYTIPFGSNFSQYEMFFADNTIYARTITYHYDEDSAIIDSVGNFNEITKAVYDNILSLINQLEDDVNDLQNTKQDKTDNSLQTTSKQVVGAINENKTNIESNYNVLNNNKLDKNFNLLVERTYAQLADFVAVRSGDQTLKMTLQTLRTYLTQGLVGLSFQIMELLPLTGVGNVFYLIPMVDTIEHFTDFADFPSVGEEKKLYIADDEHTGGATGWYNWDTITETYVSYNFGYYEYIWLEEISKFELIGSTQVDLTGYATEMWVFYNFNTKININISEDVKNGL